MPMFSARSNKKNCNEVSNKPEIQSNNLSKKTQGRNPLWIMF